MTILPDEPGAVSADARARDLADRYVAVSSNVGGDEATRLRRELAALPHAISDVVARHYAQRILAGDFAVGAVLANQIEPLWFESGRSRLVAALTEMARRDPRYATCAFSLEHGQVRRDAVENAGVLRRIASTFARAWVLGFFAIPTAVAAIVAIAVDDPLTRAIVVSAIVAVLAGVMLVDARLRRCPACKRLLAGMIVGYRDAGSFTETISVETAHGFERLDRTTHAYGRMWLCVHCRHRWEV